MMIKEAKIAAVILAASMMAGLSACTIDIGSQSTDSKETKSKATETAKTEVQEEETDDTKATDVTDVTDPTDSLPDETEPDPTVPVISGGQKIEYQKLKDDWYHIARKDENGLWSEIARSEDPLYVFGEYNDEVYYATWSGLCHVNIYSHVVTQWIEFESETYDDGYTLLNAIYDGAVIGDTLYFTFSSYSGGTEPNDGLMSLKLTDDSFDDAVQINRKVIFWDADVEHKTIYYIKADSYVLAGTFCRYDVATGEEMDYLNNVESFTREGTLAAVQPYGIDDIYLLDLETCKINAVIQGVDYSNSGSVWGVCEIRNGDLYYKMDDQLIRYNNGANEVLCTVEGHIFYGFYFLTDNVIDLVYNMEDDEFLVDGKIVPAGTFIEGITVAISDDDSKTFGINEYIL